LHLDITDLKLFVNVVDAGSITHGAQRSNMSLPAASGRIKQLEAEVKTRLLERERLGVRPTEAGRALYFHGLSVLGSLQRLNEDLAEYSRGAKGFIKLVSGTHALSEFLPDDVGAFLQAHSNVNITIEERSSQDIVEMVSVGVADVGIVVGVFETSLLEMHPYRVDHLTVVAPVDSCLPVEPVNFADLLDEHHFIGLGTMSSLPRFLDRHARRAGKIVRQRMQLSNFYAICRMVEKGIGIAIVPATAAERFQTSMAFRIIQLRDEWARRELRVCVRSNVKLPNHVVSLVAWLAHASN
jgi:DNA-binding transcriptional LysR family regulator